VGVTATKSHAVGAPDSDEDGNFRYDRQGLLANGTARRTGDVFVISDKVGGGVFVSFGAKLDFASSTNWKEIVPIVESADDNLKYTKDASLNEADVVEVTTTTISGQNINKSGTPLTVNELNSKFPYNSYLVCPALNVSLPIVSNTDSQVTIADNVSFLVSLAGKTCYIRKKKSLQIKNSVL
jgi:hypothetical protein